MCECCKNIKEAELERHEEIKEHKRINFMKSIASSVDHERRNEKKRFGSGGIIRSRRPPEVDV